MTVNIKFCGGCNPRYDRLEFAKKIQEAYPDILFLVNSADRADAVIALCGCTAACARTVVDSTDYKEVAVYGPEDFGRVFEFLEERLLFARVRT